MNLQELIHPIDPSQFFEEYWSQRPLLIERSAPNYYRAAVQAKDVEIFLLQGRVRYPEVRLIKHGKKIPFEELFHAGWLNGVASLDENPARISPIYEAYREGYTLIVRAERVAPNIAVLCRDIEQQLHHPVMSELFLTPKDSQGSLVHTDPHDVFVLQVSGVKHWRVYAPPQDCSSAPLAERVGTPITDARLHAGDMLYVPRGYPHEALTDPGNASLHLSVGVYPLKWYELAVQALRVASESDSRFNEPLPAGFLHADPKGIETQLEQLFEALMAKNIWQAAYNRVAANFCQSLRPLADNQFQCLDRFDDFTLDDHFERRSGMLCHLSGDGDLVTLAFPGNKLQLPAKTRLSLEAIANSHTPFTARDLPGTLDGNSRLVLIRHLIKAGLIRALRDDAPGKIQAVRSCAGDRQGEM
jgi:ribosomal protein L16 Arg81 hydroxylase